MLDVLSEALTTLPKSIYMEETYNEVLISITLLKVNRIIKTTLCTFNSLQHFILVSPP